MALLTWMINAAWQRHKSQGYDVLLQTLVMVALMVMGHFGGMLGYDPVSFVWISLFVTHLMGMGFRVGQADTLPTMLLIHNIPLIAWVWVQIVVLGIPRGIIMTALAMVVLAVYGPVSWMLTGVVFLGLVPLMLYRLLVDTLMGAGGLSFVWLCPLLTPVLIFGLDTLQQAAGGTLSLTGGAVYGLMSLLFCVAVLPWIVAWMIKERLTS